MDSMKGSRRSFLTLALLSLAGCAGMNGPLGQVLGGLGMPGAGNEISGQVSYVDSRYQQIQLQPNNGQTVTLDYDSRTEVVFQNQRYAVTNLERGDYVTARVQQDNRGRAYTDFITVEQSARDTQGGYGTNGGYGRNGGYGTNTRQVFQGRVGTVDYQRGYFQLEQQYGGSYTVTMPFNPSSGDLNRFRRLRSGDNVRIEGVLLNNDRIELYRFR
jgi:hypothetical protein